MERCPCCNARLGGSVLCPRCQADLGSVIGAEQAAQYWLSRAIQFWGEHEDEQSIGALDLSQHLKKTELAHVFRDFLIQQLCRDILEKLAQNQLPAAKQQLYRIRNLLPYSEKLQQLQMFTDYLLVKKQKGYPLYWPNVTSFQLPSLKGPRDVILSTFRAGRVYIDSLLCKKIVDGQAEGQ